MTAIAAATTAIPALVSLGSKLASLDVFSAPASFSQALAETSDDVRPEPTWLLEFASRHGVDDPQAPLGESGLLRSVRDGSFQLRVRRPAPQTGHEVETHRIRVSQPEQRDGTSLEDIVANVNKIAGIKARITPEGRLVIETQKRSVRFTLEEDTSGLFEALGQGSSPLRETFDSFVGETLFGQMLSSMRKTLGKPAYLHGGQTEEIFQGQLDQLLAQSMASAQGGQLADQLYDQQFNTMRRP